MAGALSSPLLVCSSGMRLGFSNAGELSFRSLTLSSCGIPTALPAVGVPPLLRLELRLQVDVLGLLERLEALLAELASHARLLHAPERPGVVVGQGIVDPDGSRLQLPHTADSRL